MARTARPWFWESRNLWAVILDGQRHLLGEHPGDLPPPRKRAGKWIAPQPVLDRFEDLRVELRTGRPPGPVPPSASPPVADVADLFLDWCEGHRSPRTFEWSQNHIQNFLDSLADKSLTVDQLRPFHLQQWVDSKTGWGANHRRGAIVAVQRALSWAEKMGHIVKSPVRHVEKPAAVRREQVLTRSEYDALVAEVKDQAFRDVLTFCWETGARVQEVRVIQAAHYRPDRSRVELPPAEAKGKKRWRIIYLTDAAERVVQRLCAAHPEGPMFRNRRGRPWDAQNFNSRFFRLQKKLGVKYALTAIRHSFATRLLEAGVDHLTVSSLLGHADGSLVLSRTYSHIGEKSDFLRDELRRASGASTA